jgi:hypothetical protein
MNYIPKAGSAGWPERKLVAIEVKRSAPFDNGKHQSDFNPYKSALGKMYTSK